MTPGPPPGRARFWLRLSLRGRLMTIGLAGLTVALVVGAVALYAALGAVVNRTLDNEAEATARQVAALVADGRLPSPIPVSGAQLIQVVDSRGRVVGASLLADRLTPLLRPDELARALTGATVEVPGSRVGLSGPLRVWAQPAGPPGASVVVALQLGDVQASQRTLRAGLLATVPLLLAVLAVIAWRVIGWTLRPVEELRTGAERISGAQQDQRLPVPDSRDEINALAVTLNTMLDRLAAARERQRSFIADAAHELRSPLTSMRTQLEVAKRLGEGGSLTTDLLTDVQRLSGLVEDLLLLARSDADRRGPVVLETVEVRGLLEGLVSDEGARGPGRVAVRVRPGPPVLVDADRAELRRAVANLVANAVRHARTRVELDATVIAGRVRVSVSDDGPGIPAGDRERVFGRFTRLDDARARDAGGSGLGLAITQELVGRAGGTVGFEDGTDGWSLRAVIMLPLADGRSR